jgi:hypothetical protein
VRAKCGQSGGDHRITATTVTPDAAVRRWTRSFACVSSFHRLGWRQKAGVRACGAMEMAQEARARPASPSQASLSRVPALPGCCLVETATRGPAPCIHARSSGRSARARGTNGGFRTGARITWEVGEHKRPQGSVGERLNGESSVTDRSVGRSACYHS